MSRLPDALFVVDTRKEKIAVDEARKLKIPVIGIVDTNCDPDEVDFVIPGNDDALRSIKLFAARVADAVLDGQAERESRRADQAAADAERAAADEAARVVRPAAIRRPQRPDGASDAGHPHANADHHELGSRVWHDSRRPGAHLRPAFSCTARIRAPGARRHDGEPNDGNHGRDGEGAPRQDRRGHDGLQGGARRSPAATSRRRSTSSARRASRTAAKRAGRATKDGMIGHYIHMGGKVGVLVEVNCETDFVARTDDFQTLAKEIAMHIAAADPRCRQPRGGPRRRAREGEGDLPRPVRGLGQAGAGHRQDRRGQAGQLLRPGLPVEQPSVRDPNVTIEQMLQAATAKTGENITITRFVRFKLGETRRIGFWRPSRRLARSAAPD